MIEIVTGVVKVFAVSMFDQNGVDGKPNFAGRTGIPESMEPIHNECSAVEQIDLGIRHCFYPAASVHIRRVPITPSFLAPKNSQSSQHWLSTNCRISTKMFDSTKLNHGCFA
jgi:hypothetical protein